MLNLLVTSVSAENAANVDAGLHVEVTEGYDVTLTYAAVRALYRLAVENGEGLI